MEIILNLAWAVFSGGLIWFWLRSSAANQRPRRMQLMALMMVVLLLLPVISLSDDLVAAQGVTETDCSLRRALNAHEAHASVVPASVALLEPFKTASFLSAISQNALQEFPLTLLSSYLPRSLDSRPPPSV
jgi:hypothetical protein